MLCYSFSLTYAHRSTNLPPLHIMCIRTCVFSEISYRTGTKEEGKRKRAREKKRKRRVKQIEI